MIYILCCNDCGNEVRSGNSDRVWRMLAKQIVHKEEEDMPEGTS